MSPSVDKNCKELDLTELYNNSVRSIYVKLIYQSRTNSGTTATPRNTYITWYSVKTASDAYKILECHDVHVDTQYATYTKSANITLSSGLIYICFWWDYPHTLYDYYAYWKDFYVEIEYPDMSTLY